MEETVSKEVEEDVTPLQDLLSDVTRNVKFSPDAVRTVRMKIKKLEEVEKARYVAVKKQIRSAKSRIQWYEALLRKEQSDLKGALEPESIQNRIRYHRGELAKEEGKLKRYQKELSEIEKNLTNFGRISDHNIVAVLKKKVKERIKEGNEIVEEEFHAASENVETAEASIPYIGPVLSGASKTVRASGKVVSETGKAVSRAKETARDAFSKLKVRKLLSPDSPKEVVIAAAGIIGSVGTTLLKIAGKITKWMIKSLAVSAMVVLMLFGPVALFGYFFTLLVSGTTALLISDHAASSVVVAESTHTFHGIYGSGQSFADYVIEEQRRNDGKYDWRRGGNVSAQYVSYYNETFGASFPVVGTEWCAIFVSVMADQCGLVEKGLIPVSAGTGAFAFFYEEKGLLHKGYSTYTPKPGDLILYEYVDDDDPLYDHIEVVVGVDGDIITCIGGNTGSSVGYDIRERSDPNIGAFCEVPYPVADDSVLSLAAVLAGEAGNHYEGALAVATVIMNRVKDSRYGNSVNEVIYAPGQFSSVNGTIYREVMSGNIDHYAMAYQAALDALDGKRSERLTGPLANCLDFRTAGYYENGSWVDSRERYPNGTEIGGNWFFYE